MLQRRVKVLKPQLPTHLCYDLTMHIPPSHVHRFGLQEKDGAWKMPPGTWFIPFNVVGPSQNGCDETIVISNTASATVGPLQNCNISSWSWFKVNREAAGYYRTTYSSAAWAALAANADEVQVVLTTADRVQLIQDAFALVSESMLEPVGYGLTEVQR